MLVLWFEINVEHSVSQPLYFSARLLALNRPHTLGATQFHALSAFGVRDDLLRAGALNGVPTKVSMFGRLDVVPLQCVPPPPPHSGSAASGPLKRNESGVFQRAAVDAGRAPWWAGAQSVLLPPPVARQIRAELTAAAAAAHGSEPSDASWSGAHSSSAMNTAVGSDGDSSGPFAADSSSSGAAAAITRALRLNVRGLDGYAHAEFSALSTHPAMGATAVEQAFSSSNSSPTAAHHEAGRAGKKTKYQHHTPAGTRPDTVVSGSVSSGSGSGIGSTLTAVGSDAGDVVFGTATVAAILHNLRALGVADARVLSSAAASNLSSTSLVPASDIPHSSGLEDNWTTIEIASLGAQIDVCTGRRRHPGGRAGASSSAASGAPDDAANMRTATVPSVAVTRVRINDLENDRAHAIVQRAVTAAVR
jgi:hypothetical protein